VIPGIVSAAYSKITHSIAVRWIFIREWFRAVFTFPHKFFRIAMEFFTEAAVLVAVFPILDTIVGPTGGFQKVTWPLVMWSEGIAAGLLLLAGIISMAVKE
jgi:hypothetical protein